MQLYYSRNGFRLDPFSFHLSGKLKSLLDNCPENMRSLPYGERLTETLRYVVRAYGYVLPFALNIVERSVNLSVFAEEIAKNYSLEEPRNHYVSAFLTELDCCLTEIEVLS